jgi:hypothetical protein
LDLLRESSGIGLEQIAERRRNRGPQPEIAWQYLFELGQPSLTPRQTEDSLVFTTRGGYIFTLGKDAGEELFRFKASAPIAAPMGQAGDIAYIGSDDFSLYALNIPAGRFAWRFVTGSAIQQRPAATDDNVYVVADRRGLYCLDRATGKEVWRSTGARRFLAVNRKFVYAFDEFNRLLVLDRNRGTRLGRLDTRAYVYHISNDLTDRVFLAAHNGLLVCLHDLDQKTPLANRKFEETKGIGRRVEKKPEKKPEAKKKPKVKPKEEEPKEEKEDKEEMKKENGKEGNKAKDNGKGKKKEE